MVGESKQAIVVDPGVKTASRVADVLTGLGMSLAAILLTHGHADHLWNAAKVSQLNPEAPVYLAKRDHFWLDEPGPAQRLHAGKDFEIPGEPWQPFKVQDPPAKFFHDGGAEIIPGLVLRALPAPGHTPGCTIFFGKSDVANDHGQELGFTAQKNQAFCFTGDVIFKQTVGRADLPNSDSELMQETLHMLCLSVNPETLILPGHGPSTTWATELTSNPFLHWSRT